MRQRDWTDPGQTEKERKKQMTRDSEGQGTPYRKKGHSITAKTTRASRNR